VKRPGRSGAGATAAAVGADVVTGCSAGLEMRPDGSGAGGVAETDGVGGCSAGLEKRPDGSAVGAGDGGLGAAIEPAAGRRAGSAGVQRPQEAAQ
jgi:hypothetical protein